MKKKFFAVALTTAMVAASTMTAMAADSAYYSFDSDAGSATLTGAKSGDAAELASPKIDNGKLALDGTYGLKLPEKITDDTYTVSFKVNYNAVTACTPTVAIVTSFEAPQDWISLGYGWQTELIPGIWARVESTDTWTDIFSETTLETGKDYTFTYTVDNLAATVYVDGVKVAEGTVQSAKNAEIYLGVNAWDTPANCTLDDLVIVNGVATSDVSSYMTASGPNDGESGNGGNANTGSNDGSDTNTGNDSSSDNTNNSNNTNNGNNSSNNTNPGTADAAPIVAFAAIAVVACAAVIVSKKKVVE